MKTHDPHVLLVHLIALDSAQHTFGPGSPEALRTMQQIDGYDATIVSGVVTQRGGQATGARPGRLVQGVQGRPG